SCCPDLWAPEWDRVAKGHVRSRADCPAASVASSQCPTTSVEGSKRRLHGNSDTPECADSRQHGPALAAMSKYAAFLFVATSFGVCAFQLALVLGAPWGEYRLGGRWKGQ